MDPDCLVRFPENRPLAGDCGRWVVACTSPRHEKALARLLAAAGIAYFLPLTQRTHLRPDNGLRRSAIVPLFPGYLAVAGLDLKAQLFATSRVVRILQVADQEGFTRELQEVQKVLCTGLKVESHHAFPVGGAVEITQGPLKGIRGIIEEMNRHDYLILNVRLFKQCIRVKIPTEDVKAGPEHTPLAIPFLPKPANMQTGEGTS
jgi:transcription antitermination factor NusG